VGRSRLLRAGTSLAFAICLSPLTAATAVRQDASAPPAFAEWLAALRVEALRRGISQSTVDLALTDLALDPTVIARDRAQPELTQSLDAYVVDRLSPKTLATAQTMLERHQVLLEQIRQAYGIPAPVMIAIWGIESNFGQVTGTRPTITALATLAFDSRRPALFRAELFNALTILDRGLVTLNDLKGSWAGAMGQPQFMPSSYLKYAVDFDHDGRADIWTSEADVFGSMANYLKTAGWTEGQRWGREVIVSPEAMARIDKTVPLRGSGCRALREMTVARPLKEWKRLGVKLIGANLPATADLASLVRGQLRRFLVYRNYRAFIDYNCSNAYAVSVGLLSDRIDVK
jgi:membrane-bound lytic murein transglycosylase B